MRRYQGNAPGDELGYTLTSDVYHGDVVWLLYAKHGSDDWVNIKLVASEPIPTKANYWIGYNRVAKKFGSHRDYYLLKENRPELLIKVIDKLSEYYG